MAILERQSSASDISDMVRELTRAVAILARSQAPAMKSDHAFDLQAVLERIHERTQRLDWVETADYVRAAEEVVGLRTSPR